MPLTQEEIQNFDTLALRTVYRGNGRMIEEMKDDIFDLKVTIRTLEKQAVKVEVGMVNELAEMECQLAAMRQETAWVKARLEGSPN